MGGHCPGSPSRCCASARIPAAPGPWDATPPHAAPSSVPPDFASLLAFPRGLTLPPLCVLRTRWAPAPSAAQEPGALSWAPPPPHRRVTGPPTSCWSAFSVLEAMLPVPLAAQLEGVLPARCPAPQGSCIRSSTRCGARAVDQQEVSAQGPCSSSHHTHPCPWRGAPVRREGAKGPCRGGRWSGPTSPVGCHRDCLSQSMSPRELGAACT